MPKATRWTTLPCPRCRAVLYVPEGTRPGDIDCDGKGGHADGRPVREQARRLQTEEGYWRGLVVDDEEARDG
jgi:hypothetical protein